MKDNGLLKYYKDKKLAEGGILDLKKTGIVDCDSVEKLYNVNSFRTKDGKKYFVKQTRFDHEVESEVLLGQVYNRVGLKNAVYTPAYFDMGDAHNNQMVVSQSVCEDDPSIIPATSFYALHKISTKDILFSKSKAEQIIDVRRLFAPSAIKDYALMFSLDLASYNVDRSLANFFVKTNEDGSAENLISIDNGICFYTMDGTGLLDAYNGRGKFPDWNEGAWFPSNCLKDTMATREQLVKDLKNNETISEHVSMHDLAEQIGSVNVSKEAQDIKETIGFEIDEDIVSACDKSFYTLAEELEQ